MKYKFTVPFPTKVDELKDLVENEAKKVVQKMHGKSFKRTIIDDLDKRAVYKVTVVFHIDERGWLKDFDRPIPREDRFDLDNLLKHVFDGLGPIIGFRKDWTGEKEHAGAWDSSIIEVYARKIKTEGQRFVEIEIEQLYEAVRK